MRKIVSYSAYLNKRGTLPNQDQNNLNVIRNSALRLNSLVDDLFKYASSTTRIEEEEVDLNKVIKEVKEDLELLNFLSKIFTIFARLQMPDEYSGNGIGLAIRKKIKENHSGKIIVESFPRDGSVFHLFFPVN